MFGLRNSFCDSIRKLGQRQDRWLLCRFESKPYVGDRRAATPAFFVGVLTDQWLLLVLLEVPRDDLHL